MTVTERDREAIIFRGGVGDFFLWLPYLQTLAQRCTGIYVNSTWPEAICTWIEAMFAHLPILDVLDYARPTSPALLAELYDRHPTIHICDVYRGDLTNLASPRALFPNLEIDPFTPLGISATAPGGTVIQTIGASVGEIEIPPATLKHAPRPLTWLDGWTDPIALYATIRGAKLLIGIDSGFRNIAFTCRVPVLEVVSPGKGNPDYEVFVPHVYRDRWTLIDPTGEILTEVP